MPTLPARTGPLVGLKVLEIGHYVAAPFCTRILADLGAEVIKIEPPGGDPFRGWGAAVDGNSVWFSIHGRNKLSVVLDLKRERDTALKLAARADVLVENLRAGQLERLGLGPEVLHAVNPRLVIARISGYGQDGPYRDSPAFGAIGEAIGGLRHLTGASRRHHRPAAAALRHLDQRRPGRAVCGDRVAGGAVAAPARRPGAASGTGRGRVIDVNLVDSVFSLMEGMLPEYALDGRVRQPVGAAIATAAPTNTYPCADGKWLCIAGNSDLIFRRLMTTIGRRSWARIRAYATNGDRCARREALDAAIARLDRAPCPRRTRGACWRRPTCPAPACTTSPTARRSAFSGARQRAGDRRSADRAHAAPGPDDPPGRRHAGAGGGVDRSRRRRAHRVRAAHAARRGAETRLIISRPIHHLMPARNLGQAASTTRTRPWRRERGVGFTTISTSRPSRVRKCMSRSVEKLVR